MNMDLNARTHTDACCFQQKMVYKGIEPSNLNMQLIFNVVRTIYVYRICSEYETGANKYIVYSKNNKTQKSSQYILFHMLVICNSLQNDFPNVRTKITPMCVFMYQVIEETVHLGISNGLCNTLIYITARVY